MAIIAEIESEYKTIKEDYSSLFDNEIKNGKDPLNSAWGVTDTYFQNFETAWRKPDSPIPARTIYPENSVLKFHFILYHYLFNMNGKEKVFTIFKTGNCSEFAVSISYLINDITGLKTRIITMEGVDHTYPETEYNNQWYVFDRILTTVKYPVLSENYSSYLSGNKPVIYGNIANLIDSVTKKSYLKEHGFNSKEILLVLYDDSGKNTDSVYIEVYLLNESSSDPLIAQGVTDVNGTFSTIIRKENKYLIRAEKSEKSGIKKTALLIVPVLDDNFQKFEIELKKYE
ncbi:hypothetical protein [Methanochimaera problematica]|nr:hypothetical protein [Methanoplanus sp. FWC-SCC4]